MGNDRVTLSQIIEWNKEEYEFIDVREETVASLGKIPDSKNIPLKILGQKLDQLDAKKKQVVYCAKGFTSKKAVSFLRQNGFEAYLLSGGYQEWLLATFSNESKECEKDSIQESLKKEEDSDMERREALKKDEDSDMESRDALKKSYQESVRGKNEVLLGLQLSTDEREQYSRQMILPGVDFEGQLKLKNASVLVIGVGALGTIAATYLCEAGVGHIGLVEGDVIDRSNLHRQMLYDADSIGKKKGEVAKNRLQKMNELIEITWTDCFAEPENIADLIADYDFVIDATDRVETKFMINDACVLAKKPFCHAGILGYLGQVLTWVPGGDVCYRCIFEDVPEDYVPNCAEAGVLGAVSGIIGSTQALEAIKYLLRTGELLTGRMLVVDGLTMKTRTVDFPQKNEDCMVCGTHPTITNVLDNASNYEIKLCAI